jgi:hypothetical protein
MWGFTFAIKFMLIFIYIRRLFYKVKLPFIHFKQKEHAKCIRFRFQLSLLRRFYSWISFETIPYEVGSKIHKVKSRLLVLIKTLIEIWGFFIWYIEKHFVSL